MEMRGIAHIFIKKTIKQSSTGPVSLLISKATFFHRALSTAGLHSLNSVISCMNKSEITRITASSGNTGTFSNGK